MSYVHVLRFSVNPLVRLRSLVQPARRGLMLAVVMIVLTGTAKASGSNMPWEAPLQSILDSI